MPSLRCANCHQQIVAAYPEALTIELAGHLEREHGQVVSLETLAPQVRRAMVGGGGTFSSLAIARIVAVLVGIFFVLVALELGPGWLALSALAAVLVVIINAVESQQT